MRAAQQVAGQTPDARFHFPGEAKSAASGGTASNGSTTGGVAADFTTNRVATTRIAAGVTAAAERALWDDKTSKATDELKSKGVQFVAADKPAFYKATQPVRDKYGSKYAALLKRIEDTR